MAHTDEDFQSGDSGASTTYPKQCSALRKNEHVMLKGHPCKIVEMSTSKTGKHGHAKVHLVGLDMITNKKYEDICPSTHNMNVPKIGRTDYQFTDLEDGYLALMNDQGEIRNDIKLPDGDIGKDISDKNDKKEQFMVTVLKVLDDEIPVGTKAITTK
ncbi:Eukaryotic translation initiation factor 5A-1 [Oopsacas minuta]|uniref:Eukaryotic translation initiation factor 5A n=1 Tax=Oopsacas minuta TaxID=111878 RepID=A0AAV7JV31_9METZ|nr:Eukaryotic translation initiation factor 5A-1 [Oopsacas minuta]